MLTSIAPIAISASPATSGLFALEKVADMTGTTRSSAGLDDRRKRLLFRCWHRGTREMDLILGGFADVHIGDLSDQDIEELENLLERAVLLTEDQQLIKLSALFPQMHSDHTVDEQDSVDLDTLLTEGFDLEQHEQQLIITAMQKAKHNVSEAARLLGISRAALDYRLKKYAMR